MNKNAKTKLFVISGSSGVGKGTVIKQLLNSCQSLSLSISSTTRQPRIGEVPGVNYFFLSKEEFQQGIKNDDYIEWAEFSGNYYGTSKSNVDLIIESGQNVLLEIETQGALQVKEKMPDSVLIFIAPPSFEELEARLRGRNTESEEAIQKRLDFVKLELENSKKYDYIVINDTIENAVSKILEIIEG